MTINKTKLDGVLVIGSDLYPDERGWFAKTFDKDELDFNVMEENKSFSERTGTLRGLHFQNQPHCQAKLISCSQGSLLDIVVDLRKNSSSYKKWIAIELSAKNMKSLFIPKGFAHGFLTLEDNTEIEYKVDEPYYKRLDRNIRYDDPELKIKWKIKNPIMSDRDKEAPLLKDCDINL